MKKAPSVAKLYDPAAKRMQTEQLVNSSGDSFIRNVQNLLNVESGADINVQISLPSESLLVAIRPKQKIKAINAASNVL